MMIDFLLLWWIPGIIATATGVLLLIHDNVIRNLTYGHLAICFIISLFGLVSFIITMVLLMIELVSMIGQKISEFEFWEKKIWEAKKDD